MAKKEYPFEFPPNQHQDCQTLTELTIEHLPPDGSLGRVLRYQKGSFVWQTDDVQDKIYFLRQPPSEIGVITIPISHNELAQMAAMSRPHVSVTMKKLRESGFVDYGRNRPLMVNVPVLRKHLNGE